MLPTSEPCLVCQTLKHILNTVEGAANPNKLSAATHVLFDIGKHVQWKENRPCVTVPSVFAKGDFVDHFMMDEEVMNTYNIELNIQSSLKTSCKGPITRSFVDAILKKVLKNIALLVVQGLVLDNAADLDATMLFSNGKCAKHGFPREDETWETGTLSSV